MREIIKLNQKWIFSFDKDFKKQEIVDIPHTYNADIDSFLRCTVYYKKIFDIDLNKDKKYYLKFNAIDNKASVYFNDIFIGEHKGGYSAFVFEITNLIKENNEIKVIASNLKDETIYPYDADFNSYGGIYRGVELIIIDKIHFPYNDFNAVNLKIDTSLIDEDGLVKISTDKKLYKYLYIDIYDKENKKILSTTKEEFKIKNAHLWNGIKDPYLYKFIVYLKEDETIYDEQTFEIGFKKVELNDKDGFYLNSNRYELHGVCIHQDYLNKGNAINKKQIEQNISLIKELGINALRVSHYQHDDYLYELCDKNGIVVFSEIPFSTTYTEKADENAKSQLREIIAQTYNHTCIVFRGFSNEITVNKGNYLPLCKELNQIVLNEDKSRYSTLTSFMSVKNHEKINHISQVRAFNMYFGWYKPFCFLTGLKLSLYHIFYPKEYLGLSAYGADCNINIHTSNPKRGDNSEEYQLLFHQKLLKQIMKRKYLIFSFVWNMFDFGSFKRENHQNTKGLVTFDRKTKKDAFYLYKAYFSEEKFIHICEKRFTKRLGKTFRFKVITNLDEITVYQNDNLIKTYKVKDHCIQIKLPLTDENNILVKKDKITDKATFIKLK